MEENNVKEIVEPEVITSIKNTSRFTKEGFKEMNSTLGRKAVVLVVLCEIVLLAIDVYLFISQSWLFAGVISVLIIGYPFLLKFMAKRQLERTFVKFDEQFKDSTYDFTFTNESCELIFTCKGEQTAGTINYSSIYSVIDKRDYIFVLISSNQAYIVEKSGFANKEDSDNLINLFKEKGIKVSIVK